MAAFPILSICSIVFSLAALKGVLGIDCYRCVYDPSQSPGISIFSAASLGFKKNVPACGHYFDGNDADKGSCNILTQGCSTIKYSTQSGMAYSRGCTVFCTNRTQTVSIGKKKYEGHHYCCKNSLCNDSGAKQLAPLGLFWFSIVMLLSFALARVRV